MTNEYEYTLICTECGCEVILVTDEENGELHTTICGQCLNAGKFGDWEEGEDMPTQQDLEAQLRQMKSYRPFAKWFGAIIAGEVVTCDSLAKLKRIAKKAGIETFEYSVLGK